MNSKGPKSYKSASPYLYQSASQLSSSKSYHLLAFGEMAYRLSEAMEDKESWVGGEGDYSSKSKSGT